MRLGLTLPLLVIASLPQVAKAEPFDFLFGGRGSERDYRMRRRAPHPPSVPMPVPRPHFPSDDRIVAAPASPASAPNVQRAKELPAKDLQAKDSAGKDMPAPSASSKPDEASAGTNTNSSPTAPLPPIKPPDLAQPPATPPAPPVGTNESTRPTDAAKSPDQPSTLPGVPEPARSAGPPLPPIKPPEVAKPADVIKPSDASKPSGTPAVAPSGATNAFTPRQPDEDATCIDRIKARKVEAEPVDIGKQPDDRCTVTHPVRLNALILPDGGKVEFPDHPTIACTTADTFSLFVRDLLVPLAKGTYGTPVASVWTGPGLECRSRDHIFGAKLSAHGQGLAVDIAQIKLADGRRIAVGEPKSDADTAFETAARAAGCGYFHTALGPGTDEYHRTHWHFDLEVRGTKGDSKYCK